MLTRERLWIAGIVALGVLAYLPALNNGFIADDFVKLNAVELLKADPGYILATPPEMFRTTSDLAFGILKTFFGYRSGFFYAFSIALHCLNCLLIRVLLRQIPLLKSSANLAALTFAVFQAPQEAVMWLAAISDPLVTAFALAALILWLRRRIGWSVLCYFVALFSKESGVMLLILIPLADYLRDATFQTRRYLWLLVPTLVFAVVFLLTWKQNYLIAANGYGIGVKAVLLLLRSLIRLLWPWFAILVALLLIDLKKNLPYRALAFGLIAPAIGMAPYMFLIYDRQLPSRSVYIASAIFMAASAYLLLQLKRPSFRVAYCAAFVGFNVLYLWFRKDGQYVQLAAPTTQLIEVMRSRKPGPIYIKGFEYEGSPEIAYYATSLAPGWTLNFIAIEGWNEKCAGCAVLRWDKPRQRYVEEK